MIRQLRIVLACCILWATEALGWIPGALAWGIQHGGRWLAGKVTAKD